MITLFHGLDRRRRIGVHDVSARIHNVATFAGMGVLAVAVACFSISTGAIELDFFDVMRVLIGGPATEDERFAVLYVRLPRILLGFMAGWAIALTGAMLQSLSQNPLADPGLLGLSQGSLVMIMLFIVFFPDIPKELYPFGAMLGGLAICLLLLLLTGRNNTGGIAILLMGIAVETALSSVTATLLLYTPQEVSYALGIWLNGSLFYSSWDNAIEFSLWFAFTIAMIVVLGKSLKAFDLGDQMAMSLGEPATYSKPVILIVAVLITSACVAQVGPLAFLGVLAPHLASFISKATGKSRLFLASMMGGTLVVLADMITRTSATDMYLPIGLTIVMIGAPLFILSLRLSSLRRAM